MSKVENLKVVTVLTILAFEYWSNDSKIEKSLRLEDQNLDYGIYWEKLSDICTYISIFPYSWVLYII